MNSRTVLSSAAFVAIVVISILAAVASSVAPARGAEVGPYGWRSVAVGELGDA